MDQLIDNKGFRDFRIVEKLWKNPYGFSLSIYTH